jgi:hypothetical protein
VQAPVRRRVLAVCCGIGVLQVDAAEDIAAWDHGGGFSEKPSVGIAADDRPALERLLRHCIRPCWSSERLTQAGDGERQICNFDKLRPDGSGQLTLTPLELLDRLARFIPPLHRHLHRHHGVFAPHAALRAQMAARAGGAIAAPVATSAPVTSASPPTAPEAPATAESLPVAIGAQSGVAAFVRPLQKRP